MNKTFIDTLTDKEKLSVLKEKHNEIIRLRKELKSLCKTKDIDFKLFRVITCRRDAQGFINDRTLEIMLLIESFLNLNKKKIDTVIIEDLKRSIYGIKLKLDLVESEIITEFKEYEGTNRNHPGEKESDLPYKE